MVIGFKLLIEGDVCITSAYGARILISQNISGVCIYIGDALYVNRPIEVYLVKLI